MASQKDKLTATAMRMKTRSFPGYIADRVLGRADFEGSPSPTDVKSMPRMGMGAANPDNDAAREAAGMKSGGAVRGWGSARGARKAKYR